MQRFIKILEKAQITVGVIFLSIFFITIMIQITTRHLGIAAIWTEEVANYSFIWAVFMGAAVMVNRREHFNFDFFQRKLKHRPRLMLSIFNDIILILFNIAIFYYGVEVVQKFWNYNWVSLPEVKMGYVWISVPIMACTMFIYSFSHLLDHFKGLRQKGVHE
ncbi:TRAP transporter small permease [Alkalihalobacillus sp. AL-G]|uniref:TRAP transporter small permease n=1 Tax=Alkalihalobacillus sp. AL-G TaxID=2926399 RepID=UPI00272D43D3|nr:TRAP transporter small permease [Alkalihalobacillus sp. AL-G]WLD93332.1 TRAP transporter small permease [Alkalihalobacillus sp. AL-G]